MMRGPSSDTKTSTFQLAAKRNGKKDIKREPLPMASKVISDIIYPVQTKRGLKWGKNSKAAIQ